MTINTLLDKLKNHFSLKNKHVLILRCLQDREFTAIDICKKTGIPQGRIYELLNELLGYGLIEKGDKKPTLYSMHDVSDKVLNYLKFRYQEFIHREAEIMDQIENIDAKEKIKLINTKKNFTFALAGFFTSCKQSKMSQIYQIGRHQSLPFLVYPFGVEKFSKMRELICKKRATVSHTSIASSLFIYKQYHELYRFGTKFTVIVEKESLDYHIELIRNELGRKFLITWIQDLVERIKSKTMDISVLDEYLAMGADISRQSVILSLIHLGFVTALSIDSKKIAEVYIKLFENMSLRSEPLIDYLKKSKLTASLFEKQVILY